MRKKGVDFFLKKKNATMYKRKNTVLSQAQNWYNKGHLIQCELKEEKLQRQEPNKARGDGC